MPYYSAASLHAFLAANLGPGATAKTSHPDLTHDLDARGPHRGRQLF